MAKAKKQERAEKQAKVQVLVQVRVDAGDHARFTRMCRHYGQTVAHRLKLLVANELRDDYPAFVAVVNNETHASHAVVEGHGRASDGMSSHDEYHVAVLPEDAEGFLPEALAEGAEYALPMCTPKRFTLGHSYVDENKVWHLRLVEAKGADSTREKGKRK